MTINENLAQNTTAIVLAGGRGTRIANLTGDVPKPMVQVASQPFLEWILRRLKREGFTQILLSIGYKAEAVESWLSARPHSGLDIAAHKEHEPLGTGGAIADALDKVLSDYVLILNGDTLLLTELLPAVKKIADDKCDGVIVARFLEDTGRYGRLAVEGDALKAFAEKTPGRGLINGGVYAFRTAWLRNKLEKGPSSVETEVFPRLLKEGARIGAVTTTAPFIDIGTPETLAQATAFVEAHKDQF